MYADTGIMFPYFRNFSQEVEELDELFHSQKSTSLLKLLKYFEGCRVLGLYIVFIQWITISDSIIPTSTISDYDLGFEGDLFKAPKPIIEEQLMGLDPMTEAIVMMSRGNGIMLSPVLVVGGMETLQNEPLLSDAFDGCTRELSEKTVSETTVSDVSDVSVVKPQPVMAIEARIDESKSLFDSPFTKCGSSGSLSSMECVNGITMRPNFLDFHELDFGAAVGMRRAFSEGDIKALGNGNISLIQRPLVIGNCTSEIRLQKLSRYRDKKSRRNFGRKIKYACRKALADNQPRIRGRFAKTEDTDSCKKQ